MTEFNKKQFEEAYGIDYNNEILKKELYNPPSKYLTPMRVNQMKKEFDYNNDQKYGIPQGIIRNYKIL